VKSQQAIVGNSRRAMHQEVHSIDPQVDSIGLKDKNKNQCDRRDPTASRWGLPHSVTTSQIGSQQAAGFQTQFVNEPTCQQALHLEDADSAFGHAL
jgi:hypothetical protein